MNRSIRWQLVFWYTILSAVMASLLGGLTYYQLALSLEREIDRALLAAAESLSAVTIPAPDGTFDIELSSGLVEQFQDDSDQALYYKLWDNEKQVIDSSDPTRSIPLPASPVSRTRDFYREVCIAGPAGSMVLVGRSIRAERAQLIRFAMTVLFTCIAVLAVMVAGGWFLTNKALRPIERISAAAESISESNLSVRIDASRMERELGQLSATINDAFDRLQSVLDRQRQFTADASHELRTPLTTILTHAEFALRTDRSVQDYQKGLVAIHRAATRMRHVIEGLLILARGDAGQVELTRTRFDLSTVVNEVASLLEPLSREKGIAIGLKLESVYVDGDRDRLAEVVTNLLSNAIQYNHDNGHVEISLTDQNGKAELKVTDTGIGVAAEDLEQVFVRFYRVDAARAFTTGGSGLGLAIVHSIVADHGGSVSVTSELGKGTEFTLLLESSPGPEA